VTSQDGTSTGPGVEPIDEDEAGGSDAEGKNAAEDGAGEAFAVVIDELNRVREQLEQLVRIQVDRAKLRWRERLLRFAWFAVGAVVLLTATIAAVFYVLAGVAGLLATVLESPPWVGDLVAGVLFLVVLGGALGVGGNVLRRRNLARLRQDYETPAPSRKARETRP